MSIDTEEGLRLEAAATQGEWRIFPHWCKNDPDPGPYADTLLIGGGQYETLAEVRPGSDDFGAEYEANAALIAFLRNNAKALLQAYREREAMREALTSIIARVGPAAGGSTLQALSGLSDVEAIARAALRAGTGESEG